MTAKIKMLPELENLAAKLRVEAENPNALDAKDIAYLTQIQTTKDLLNFTDNGNGKMVALAADAAKSLGQPDEWIKTHIDDPYYNPAETKRDAATPQSANQDFSRSGLGIGSLSHHIEDPLIPSEAGLARVEQMHTQATTCRRCHQSDLFDGAMFTTDPASGLCDDCC